MHPHHGILNVTTFGDENLKDRFFWQSIVIKLLGSIKLYQVMSLS